MTARSLLTVTAAASVAGLAATFAAAQTKTGEETATRQLGAHVHGTGKLNIALERRTLEIEIEAPGADIVGFEHTAKTAEQRAAIAKARAQLGKPMELFVFPAAAGCKQTSAKVQQVGHSHGHKHSHGHSHGSAKGGAADEHMEFHAEYTFTCAKPDALVSLDTNYFKLFAGAQALEVTFIGGKTQTKGRLTREATTFKMTP